MSLLIATTNVLEIKITSIEIRYSIQKYSNEIIYSSETNKKWTYIETIHWNIGNLEWIHVKHNGLRHKLSMFMSFHRPYSRCTIPFSRLFTLMSNFKWSLYPIPHDFGTPGVHLVDTILLIMTFISVWFWSFFSVRILLVVAGSDTKYDPSPMMAIWSSRNMQSSKILIPVWIYKGAVVAIVQKRLIPKIPIYIGLRQLASEYGHLC